MANQPRVTPSVHPGLAASVHPGSPARSTPGLRPGLGKAVTFTGYGNHHRIESSTNRFRKGLVHRVRRVARVQPVLPGVRQGNGRVAGCLCGAEGAVAVGDREWRARGVCRVAADAGWSVRAEAALRSTRVSIDGAGPAIDGPDPR